MHGTEIDDILGQDDGTTDAYYYKNHLGSVMKMTDGTNTDLYDYDAWGEKVTSGSSFHNPYIYTGREIAENNLYYYRARYYLPEVGRFVSADPVANTLQIYSYVSGNPILAIDPFGLEECGIEVVQWFDFYGGVDIAHKWIQWGPSVNGNLMCADFAPTGWAGLSRGQGRTTGCDWDPDMIYKTHKKGKESTLSFGPGTGECCSTASCGYIKACIEGAAESWNGKMYSAFFRHCGDFVDFALESCCLEREGPR